jgi:hypothetical protein
MSLKTRILSSVVLLAGLASPVTAELILPAPYVSNALDAVLLPINADVRDSFLLAPDDEGVLVLAVAPGGVADVYGILPGDVLWLEGTSDPVHVDEIVYYWIISGYTVFDFDIWRDGSWFLISAEIDEEWYWTGFDITTVSSWSSWSYESWSYEEYVTSYSEEITMTWESSETTIMESVSSEEFAAEMETYAEEEGDGPESDDESMADGGEEEGDGPEPDEETMADGDEEFVDDGGGDE